MDERLERALREKLRTIGREFERTRNAYSAGKNTSDTAALPTDAEGRAKLVCRRHAEKRAVAVDEANRPACFDPEHTDCVGCVEDIQNGRIETWE